MLRAVQTVEAWLMKFQSEAKTSTAIRVKNQWGVSAAGVEESAVINKRSEPLK